MRILLALVAIVLSTWGCSGYVKPSPEELSQTVGQGKPAPGWTFRNPCNPDFNRFDDKPAPKPPSEGSTTSPSAPN